LDLNSSPNHSRRAAHRLRIRTFIDFRKQQFERPVLRSASRCSSAFFSSEHDAARCRRAMARDASSARSSGRVLQHIDIIVGPAIGPNAIEEAGLRHPRSFDGDKVRSRTIIVAYCLVTGGLQHGDVARWRTGITAARRMHQLRHVDDEEPRPAEGGRVEVVHEWVIGALRAIVNLAVAPTPTPSQSPPTDWGCLRGRGANFPSSFWRINA